MSTNDGKLRGQYTPQSPMIISMIAMVNLGFIVDASLGRGILLRGLVHSFLNPIRLFVLNVSGGSMFTLALLLSSFLFIFLWLFLERNLDNNVGKYLIVVLILFVSTTISILLSIYSSNFWLWFFTSPWLFNLFNFLLFSLATIALSKGAMVQRRGLITGVGVASAMLFSIFIIIIGSQPVDVLIQISIIAVSTVILSIPAIILVISGWKDLLKRGIKISERSKQSSLSILKGNKHLLYAILSGSLFLVGSGMAHQFLVSTKSAILSVSPIWGFIIAGIAMLIFGSLSDYLGRYSILVGAILLNTSSQILAILGGNAIAISALEIGGYYTSLGFIMIKISDHVTPRIQKLAGVAWGVIYIADFSGFMISEMLIPIVEQEVLFYLSILFMLASLILVLAIPNLTQKDATFEAISILSGNGDEIYSSLDISSMDQAKLHQLIKIRREHGLDSPKHIEFEDGRLAIITDEDEITTAAFVNLHSSSLEESVYSLSEKIAEISKGRDDLKVVRENIDSVVRNHINVFHDAEGTNVQFAV